MIEDLKQCATVEAGPPGQRHRLGCRDLLEDTPAIVLFGPLLFPVARAIGIHEVHYAMTVFFALGLGLFAPAFGVGFHASLRHRPRRPGPGDATCVAVLRGAGGGIGSDRGDSLDLRGISVELRRLA